MKHAARRILLLLGALVLSLGFLVMAVFSRVSQAYVERQAEIALTWSAGSMAGGPSLDDESWLTPPPDSVPVMVDLLIVGANHQWIPQPYDEPSPLDAAVIAFCAWRPEEMGRMIRANLLGQELFVLQQRYAVYEDDPAEIMIHFANVTPLKNYSLLLHSAFLAVLLLAGGLFCFMGFRMGQRMENAQEKVKHLFQNASHELKTPLQSIQGYAEGIALGIMPDVQGAAQVILDQSERMSGLVDELLTISRLDSGQVHLHRVPLDARELADSAANRAQAAAQARGVALTVTLPDTPCPVLADEKCLLRAVGSVVENALRYAEKEVALTVQADGRNAFIRVTDDGPGVDAADVPHLFERFYAGKAGGTGIGLSLARDLLAAHGGSVRYVPGGSGARFDISLPLHEG